ncbi:MAG TPA: FAD-binding protein, partial [Microbacteriaceae bacterium]|nr:FAD-binding protein [Microbacteriaceae bacterium]
GGSDTGITVSANARAPLTAPFYAIEVQPSVTFTFGGIAIDDQARAIGAQGDPVPGLFAAGADIGGLSNFGYAGGLAPAYITGRWAGRNAAALARRETARRR